MKMKELERRTGVSRQMVQFYLAHGLLPEPHRPKPNVAEYGEEHVRAIGVVRRLQTEGRLKINEIKQAPNGTQASAGSEVAVLPHLETLCALRTGLDNQLVPLKSLLGRNAQVASDSKILEEVDAIEIRQENGEAVVTRMDAQIITLWGELRASGYTESRGWSPKVVAMYVKAARDLANAEIDLFEKHFDSDMPVEERAAMAEAGSKLMLGVFTVLRMKAEFDAFERAENGPEVLAERRMKQSVPVREVA